MKIILIALLAVMIAPAILCAEEKITLSTYYPAPYGKYWDLEARDNFTVGEEGTTSDPLTSTTTLYGDLFILPQNRDGVEGLEGGNVGIGTDVPETKLEVVGGAIKATGGLIIETRTDDPAASVDGQLWLRTDIS
jgi:hypothetical protein